MSDFEREIVHCLNHFFKTHYIQGFAYRLNPSRSTIQPVNVQADSLNPAYQLSIECKSIIDKKLYFSQHFRTDKHKVHQVDAISAFLIKTGRTGFLAVEFRQDPGKVSEAFLIPWPVVVGHYKAGKGITIDDARACIALLRSKGGYLLETLNAK